MLIILISFWVFVSSFAVSSFRPIGVLATELPPSYEDVMAEMATTVQPYVSPYVEIGVEEPSDNLMTSIASWVGQNVTAVAEKLGISDFKETFGMSDPEALTLEDTGLSTKELLGSALLIIPFVMCGCSAIGSVLAWAYAKLMTRISESEFRSKFLARILIYLAWCNFCTSLNFDFILLIIILGINK